MIGGSQQLRIFRRAIADGTTLEEACAATGPNGITPAEGRIYLANDAKNPPPPEAYELIGQSRKETAMAAAASKEDGEGAGINGEYKRPNVVKAFEIYDKEIKPKNAHLSTIKGDLAEPHKRIKDDCHFPRSVLNFIIALEGMEDSKRDHHLLALSEGLKHRKLHVPTDLVSMAQGKDGGNVVPLGERQRPKLATFPMGVPSDGTETDLADAGEDQEGGSQPSMPLQMEQPDEAEKTAQLIDGPLAQEAAAFEESSPEELAAQQPRKRGRKPKAAPAAES